MYQFILSIALVLWLILFFWLLRVAKRQDDQEKPS